jgi:hypothetical protein
MSAGAATWLDLGPAEFDARRLPRGHQRAPADQGALFFAAVLPARVKARTPAELPGQVGLFGDTTTQREDERQ